MFISQLFFVSFQEENLEDYLKDFIVGKVRIFIAEAIRHYLDRIGIRQWKR